MDPLTWVVDDFLQMDSLLPDSKLRYVIVYQVRYMSSSKVVNQHTELEHTPKKTELPTGWLWRDSGFIVGGNAGGLPIGCAISGCGT